VSFFGDQMKELEIPKLYKQYFIDKKDERRKLFENIKNLYKPKKGIYPGSFVHISPSFYIREMTYIDSDKRISNFFKDDKVLNFIKHNKNYDEDPKIYVFQADFSSELPIDINSFDILFSFYAGFISQSCKRYLKNQGILVCNNSHGDASLAYTDEEYELIAIIKRNGDKFCITDTDLDEYFIKKDNTPIDIEKVQKKMVGENFTKKGYAYVFKFHRNPKNDT